MCLIMSIVAGLFLSNRMGSLASLGNMLVRLRRPLERRSPSSAMKGRNCSQPNLLAVTVVGEEVHSAASDVCDCRSAHVSANFHEVELDKRLVLEVSLRYHLAM